jgi:hypothetical protein
MAAWLEGQQAFARLAGAAIATDPATSGAAQAFAAQYRLLFTPPDLLAAGAEPAATGESMRRYQQAAGQVGRLLSEAATEAGRRLGIALADDGTDAAPITSLLQLQALWIDCGEAAWSALAHREEFAEAQAELLAAWAALRASGKAG